MLGRLLCWLGMRRRERPDLSPGWQDRAEKLREVIRTCKHKGKQLRNVDNGRPFCANCGLYMDGDGTKDFP